MKVYTKSGDKGTTSLVNGLRIEKDDLRIEAYGTVDELNSFVGLLLGKIEDNDVIGQLTQIQHYLFTIGSNLACDDQEKPDSIPSLEPGQVKFLEECIDGFDQKLPRMTHFIIPGGHEQVSISHVARTVCRRAERRVVSLQSEAEVVMYLNRLSDYFFVLSRYLAHTLNVEEVKWIPNK